MSNVISFVQKQSGVVYLCFYNDLPEPLVSLKPMTKEMFPDLIACVKVDWKEGMGL